LPDVAAAGVAAEAAANEEHCLEPVVLIERDGRIVIQISQAGRDAPPGGREILQVEAQRQAKLCIFAPAAEELAVKLSIQIRELGIHGSIRPKLPDAEQARAKTIVAVRRALLLRVVRTGNQCQSRAHRTAANVGASHGQPGEEPVRIHDSERGLLVFQRTRSQAHRAFVIAEPTRRARVEIHAALMSLPIQPTGVAVHTAAEPVIAARPHQPRAERHDALIDERRIRISAMCELCIRDQPHRRAQRHGMSAAQHQLAEGRAGFNVAWIECESQKRSIAGRAVRIAVVARAELRRARPARGREQAPARNGVQVTLDDGARLLRRRLRQQIFKLFASLRIVAARESSPRQLDTSAGEIGLGGNHSLKRNDGVAQAPAVERGNAAQIIGQVRGGSWQ
jgi:hypothetical protein